MDPNDLPPLSTDVVVPDDARDLAREVEEYRREQRALQRARRRGRRFGWLVRNRRGLPRIAVVAAVVFLLAAGAALALLAPGYGRHTTPRAPAPLARPTVPAGHVGGLLPDVALRAGGAGQRTGLASIRDVRPAVVVVVPAACSCTAVMASVLRAAQSHGVRAYLVGPAGDGAAGDRLRDLAAPDPAIAPAVALVDTTGALGAAFPSQGGAPTAVIVDQAGVIQAVAPGLADADPVRAALDRVIEISG